MENLPREVLSEIFVRLLAKQVAQMRCVCKSWNALLSESSFVKSHLQRSIQNNDKILLFFRKESFCTSFTVRPSRSPNLKFTNFIKLPVNFPQKYSVIGSVNGLICFYYISYDNDCVVGFWNPSLSALLTLPPVSLHALEPGIMLVVGFGFGFDPKTDDYKVVKITTALISHVQVYSMRKGSWKTIPERFPSHIKTSICGNKVCVDGHLHWLGWYTDQESKKETIVSFDLGAETFREIPLPDSIPRYNVDRPNVLGVLGGKLCVMSSARDGECEVWVMDEYGVPQSWVKHHVFSQLQLGGYTRPYGFTSRDEFLFQAGGRFGLYDPAAAKTKTFKVKGVYKIVEYVDSLVWVA